MIKSSVARRYAKALFELLDAASIGVTRAGLAGLAGALAASPALKHVLASPAVVVEEKQAVLSALSKRLGGSPVVDGFLAQLVRKNRVGLLPEIADAFALLEDEAKDTQPVSVTSANPLPHDQQESLRTRLRQTLRREVDLTFEAKPNLLAGLQIRIGSTVFDSTVRSRLTALQAILTKE